MSEWNATAYNQISTLQAAMANEELTRLTFNGDERVLDVGCGDGKITAEIATRVPQGTILGVDPSQNMIEFASSHFPPATHPNLRFEVADARRLPYQEEFERIVSFNALHWVPEQVEALRSIRNALSEGGQALLRFVPQGPRESLEDVIEETRQSPKWASYFIGFHKPYVHFTPEEYRDLASQNGLRVVKLEVMDRAWDFKTRDGFAAFAHATFVEWTRHLPESSWGEFIGEVLDRYAKVAATSPAEAHTFKFYQMEVVLDVA